MNDVEQRLAAWLQQGTPEPPRLLTVEDIVDGAEPFDGRAPRRTQRVWLPALAGALVIAVAVAVLAIVVSTRGNGHPTPAISPSPTRTAEPAPKVTAGPAQPPADFTRTRLVGADGRYAWKLTDALRVTPDGGAHWRPVPLPAGVAPAAVDDVRVAGDGTVFVFHAPRDRTLALYRRPAGSTEWAETTLAPTMPGDYAVPFVGGISANGRVLAVLVDWGTTPTHAYSELFLSTDGGATFTARPTGLDLYAYGPVFADARTGLLIAGPNDNLVYRTTDGGQHWTKVLGGPAALDVSFGPLAANRSGVVVTRVAGVPGGVAVALYRSTDGGATFRPVADPLRLRNAEVSDERFVSAVDDTVWVITTSRIYESNNGGATWTRVRLAQHVRDVELADPLHAVGRASANCSTNAAEGCWTGDYLVATSDGGRTWRSI